MDQKIVCVVILDRTGSMSSFKDGLLTTLNPFLQAIALTQLIDGIGVLTYGDYDSPDDQVCKWSGFADCKKQDNLTKLMKFVNNIVIDGGGGFPEAFKTSLYVLLKNLEKVPKDTVIHVIHMTDAPPHTLELDKEGVKEKYALGDMFETCELLKKLKEYQYLRYICLTTCLSSIYVYMAHHLNGSVHILSTENIINDKSIVIDAFKGVFNLWMPSLGILIKNVRKYINGDTLPDTNVLESCLDFYGQFIQSDQIISNPCSFLDTRLKGVELNIAKNKNFKSSCFDQMIEIVKYPLAITIVPLLGKLYRELMKERSDPRRDMLVSEFNKGKLLLSDTEKKILEKWNAETFDNTEEVNEIIKEYVQKNKIEIIIQYKPREQIPIDKIVHSLSNPSKDGNIMIREVLSAITIKKNIQTCAISGAITIQPNSIPLGLELKVFFSILMHIVASGTMLSRRNCAIFALHIIQSGHFLTKQAIEYLEIIKGCLLLKNKLLLFYYFYHKLTHINL